jgi:hypothetical protein
METMALLRKERQVLVDRLAEIDKMLRQYEELDRVARTLLASSSRSTDKIDSRSLRDFSEGLVDEKRVVEPQFTGHVGHREKTPIDEFERAVMGVLREADAPMDRAELYDALTERGVVIGDGDRDKELNALSARVYRMAQAGHLESKRGQGYRLKEPASFSYPELGQPEHERSREESDLDDIMG